MARLTLDEVLTSIFDSDDDSDDFGHLDSENEDEEDEGVSAYTCQQQFSLEKLAALSQVDSTEPLASSGSSSSSSNSSSSSSNSSSSSRLCVVQFMDSAGALEKQTLLVNE